MDINQQQKEATALEVLRSTGNDILEAALIARETLKSNRGNALRARKCIAAGAEELKKQERTVSFEKAAAFALEARRERRVTIHKPLLRTRYVDQRPVVNAKAFWDAPGNLAA